MRPVDFLSFMLGLFAVVGAITVGYWLLYALESLFRSFIKHGRMVRNSTEHLPPYHDCRNGCALLEKEEE
jgi:hypothetical protein